MLTLTDHPDNVQIAELIDGTKRTPIYFHPRKNVDLKIHVEDISEFNTEEFRERFAITRVQASEIMDHLKNDTEPEGSLQSVFFKVKSFINNSLFIEMDLRSSTTQRIEVNFPPGNSSWGELSIVCGASSSGKTYYIADKVKRNLDGHKKNRRRFIWVSAEWIKDKTVSVLKKDKYRPYVTGIDVGEQSFVMSTLTRQAFFEREVRDVIDESQPGTVVIFDDPVDSAISQQLRPFISKLLRTARHDGIGLLYIVHSIKSGSWSSQAHNSVKYFVLFPRSQKGKIRNYLNQDVGLTMKESREHVTDFADSGRVMMVRIHAPQALIGEKLIRLI